ncbi:MAG: hypothetical protein ACJARD_001240 [Alphaproteobacteria bacterium]|jgi:hypothetical protein
MSKIFRKFTGRFFGKLRFISIKTVFIIAIILGLIYAMIWFYIANETTNKIIHHIDEMRYHKINISIDDYDSMGFPDHFATFIKKMSYRNTTRSFGWKTDSLIVYPPLLKETDIMIDASSDHFFSMRNQDTDMVHKIAVRNDICKANILFNDNKLKSLQIKALNGVVQLHEKQQTYVYKSLEVETKASNVILEDRLEDILQMSINIQDIRPTSKWKKILEDNFLYFTANLYLRNPSYFHELSKFDRYINRNYDPPEIIINDMELVHRLSKFKLKGLLAFDTDMTLNGTMILTVSNYQKILKFLTKKGVLSKGIATNVRFMLSFLSSTKTLQKNDGSVDIALTVKKNVVYSDKIKLFDFNI